MGRIDGGNFYVFRPLCPSVTLATERWHQSAGFPRSLSSSSLSVVFNYVRLPSRLSSPVPLGSILHGAAANSVTRAESGRYGDREGQNPQNALLPRPVFIDVALY